VLNDNIRRLLVFFLAGEGHDTFLKQLFTGKLFVNKFFLENKYIILIL
jgi:hypothetical protein